MTVNEFLSKTRRVKPSGGLYNRPSFAEDEESPTDSVYPQVPVSLVDELLEKHGGISRILPIYHQ